MLGKDGRNTDWVNMPLGEMLRGNALDAYFTMKCFKKLWKEVEKNLMVDTYNKLVSPAISMFIDMEMRGMDIDINVVNTIGTSLEDGIQKVEDSLLLSPVVKDKSMSLTSTKDLMALLYSCDKHQNIIPGGFGLFPPVFTEKGSPSTSAEALEILLGQINLEIARRDI